MCFFESPESTLMLLNSDPACSELNIDFHKIIHIN